jgi:hypothetical protein
MSHNITVQGGTSVRLPTAGKYCDRDIVITADYDVYEGTYKVTPAVSEQTLDTSNKLMQSDVLVEKIPYAEVKNNSGGKTVTIGSEV